MAPRANPGRALAYYMLAEQLASKRGNLNESETSRLRDDVKRLREQLPPDEVAAAQTYYQELSPALEASQSGKELIDQTPYTPTPGTASSEERSIVR